MSMFEPFQNDHQSMQIGELIFENQTDKVIVYGDIDIKKSANGLEQALKIQKVFNDIVHNLQNDQQNIEKTLSSGLQASGNIEDKEDTSSKEIDNPFS